MLHRNSIFYFCVLAVEVNPPRFLKRKKMIKELNFKGKNLKVDITNHDEHLQKYWALGVFYEADLLNYIYENYKRGLNFIDVGGCIGNHTLFFASVMEANKVTTFEPVPELAEHIHHNVELNGIPNVNIYNLALHNKKGSANINMSDLSVNAGMSEISENGDLQIKTNRLDNYTFDKIDLIKIDIEGNNINMLKGAKKTLIKHKPDIFIESTDDFKEVEKILSEYGYKFTGKTFCKTPTHLFIQE